MHNSMVAFFLLAASRLAIAMVIESFLPALNATEISAILNSPRPVITSTPSLEARMMTSPWIPATGNASPTTAATTGPLNAIPTIDIEAMNPGWTPQDRHLGHGPHVHGPPIHLDPRAAKSANATSPSSVTLPKFLQGFLGSFLAKYLPLLNALRQSVPGKSVISVTAIFKSTTANGTATETEAGTTTTAAAQSTISDLAPREWKNYASLMHEHNNDEAHKKYSGQNGERPYHFGYKRAGGAYTKLLYPTMMPGETSTPLPTATQVIHILPRRQGRYNEAGGPVDCGWDNLRCRGNERV